MPSTLCAQLTRDLFAIAKFLVQFVDGCADQSEIVSLQLLLTNVGPCTGLPKT